MSAAATAGAVRGRAMSAVEATRRCLDRIADLDPKLHAFQVVRADKALAEAAEVDRRGEVAGLPLAGVPVAVKDNFNVAGEPTRHGSDATGAAPANNDDEAVRRLRAAGAIVVGKTTMPELAIFGFTESKASGVTRNPWNPNRSPGGSSGGSAVAVATGMAELGLATDGLGSTRIPSAFCGVAGLKSTRGLLPLMGGLAEHWYGFSVTGCMATSVADIALMLGVLAGANDHRDVAPPSRPLRIALSTKPATFIARLSPEVEKSVRATAALLEGAGHHVTEADPPYPLTLANHVLRAWMAGVAQDARPLQWPGLERRTRTMAALGKRLGPAPASAFDAWTELATRWFADFDVALMPVAAVTSIPAGVWTRRGLASTLVRQVRAYPYAAPWNAAGFPAMAVPAGVAADGVPLSVQVVAPRGGDALLLSVASQLEALKPWPAFA